MMENDPQSSNDNCLLVSRKSGRQREKSSQWRRSSATSDAKRNDTRSFDRTDLKTSAMETQRIASKENESDHFRTNSQRFALSGTIRVGRANVIGGLNFDSVSMTTGVGRPIPQAGTIRRTKMRMNARESLKRKSFAGLTKHA